jgi:hypothetical protein
MKNILTLAITLFFITNINAQSLFRVGGSFNVVIPTGDYTKIAKSGIGGSVVADYILAPQWQLILSTSYSSIKSKIPQIGIDSKAIDFYINSINILFGGRYNFNYSFFVLAKSGISYIKLHASIYDSPSNSEDEISSDYESYFSASFGGGYRYNLAKDKSDFELAVIYNYTKGDIINFNAYQLKASVLIYL